MLFFCCFLVFNVRDLAAINASMKPSSRTWCTGMRSARTLGFIQISDHLENDQNSLQKETKRKLKRLCFNGHVVADAGPNEWRQHGWSESTECLAKDFEIALCAGHVAVGQNPLAIAY